MHTWTSLLYNIPASWHILIFTPHENKLSEHVKSHTNIFSPSKKIISQLKYSNLSLVLTSDISISISNKRATVRHKHKHKEWNVSIPYAYAYVASEDQALLLLSYYLINVAIKGSKSYLIIIHKINTLWLITKCFLSHYKFAFLISKKRLILNN